MFPLSSAHNFYGIIPKSGAHAHIKHWIRDTVDHERRLGHVYEDAS